MDMFAFHYNRALRFLARRPRSEKEVRDNLQKKKIEPDVLEKIIVKLKEQKFLNDEEFASWWIDQRTRISQKGMRVIRLELLQKGIEKDIIDAATGDRQAATRETDEETARKIVEKKFVKFKNLPREEIYKKLGGHLARRGYNWDTIKASIDEAMAEKV